MKCGVWAIEMQQRCGRECRGSALVKHLHLHQFLGRDKSHLLPRVIVTKDPEPGDPGYSRSACHRDNATLWGRSPQPGGGRPPEAPRGSRSLLQLQGQWRSVFQAL